MRTYPSGEAGRGIQKDLVFDRGVDIKRLLRTLSGQTLAFTMLSSTDPLTETDAASQVAAIGRRIHEDFSDALLFVIAVGYSSEEVKQILEPTAVIIGFEEKRFESDLRIELAKRVKQGVESGPVESKWLADATSRLEQKLHTLSDERRVAYSGAQQQLAERLEERAAPEVKAREARTRWELIDILDKLQDIALGRDPFEERRLMPVCYGSERTQYS